MKEAQAAQSHVAIIFSSTRPLPHWKSDINPADEWARLEEAVNSHFEKAWRNQPLPVLRSVASIPLDSSARVRLEDGPDGEKRTTILPITAWREVTATINRAYAAHHQYDFFYAQIANCPRGPTWCQKMSALSLLSAVRKKEAEETKRKWDWFAIADEDQFFSNFSFTIDELLRDLYTPTVIKKGSGRMGGRNIALKDVNISKNGRHFHAPASGPSAIQLVIGKEIQSIKGVNCGLIFLRNSDAASQLLRWWWRVPIEHPDQRRFERDFPREQGVFNTHVAYEAYFRGQIAVVPTRLIHFDLTIEVLSLLNVIVR